MSRGESADTANVQVLFLTTRDVNTPQTGADNRAKYLYEGLERTFAVDLVHFDRTEGAAASTVGTAIQYPPSELVAVMSVQFLLASIRAVRHTEYHIVVTSGIGAVTYGLVASVLSRATFVFDDHNFETEVAKDRSLPRFVVVAILERLACAHAVLVVVPTTEVKEALAPQTSGEVAVVANGYDADTYSPDGPAVEFDGPRLLFFGNYEYPPNQEAVEYIVDELAPRLETADVAAKILLAGPGHEAIRDRYELTDAVELLGFVEDLPATIRGADIVIVPLRSGSGSRLKIIEALACGTPVVSTPIGASGWPTHWANLTIASLDKFAAAVIAALGDPTFDPGDQEAIAAYSWQAQSHRFTEAILQLVESDV